MSTVKFARTEELEARLPPRLGQWARYFAAAELCFDIDAFTLAAICDRESRGGDALRPRGPTGTGDIGHGRGLMQIDDRHHKSFIQSSSDDGTPLWKQPAFNIMYAARLLAANKAFFDGDEAAAIAAYNAGAGAVQRALGAMNDTERIKRLDEITTNDNYLSDVIRRRSDFLKEV